MLNDSLKYMSHNYAKLYTLKIFKRYYNTLSLKRYVENKKILDSDQPITLATYAYSPSYWNNPYNNYGTLREVRADTVFKRIWFIAKRLNHVGKFSKYNQRGKKKDNEKQRR